MRLKLFHQGGEFLSLPRKMPEPLSANMTETPASFGITVGRWR